MKASPATSELGHSVTLTATVSPASASGTVTFYRGVNVLETEPVSNGTATFTTTLLPFGSHSLTAYYSGNGEYGPSTSPAAKETVKSASSKGSSAPILTGANTSDLYSFLAVGDLNRDGKADLVTTGICTCVTIFLGNGDGTFAPPADYGLGMVVSGPVVVGDFNGDGIPDLAVASFGGVLDILLGNGDGTFQNPIVTETGSDETQSIVLGDFNGDGKADVALAGEVGFIYVLLGNGNGTLQAPELYGGSFFANSLVVADLNGDGKADLVANNLGANGGGPFGLTVLLGNGDGSFGAPLPTPLLVAPYSLATADFNGDGIADLAASSYNPNAGSDGEAVLLGNGDGTFQPPAFYDAGSPNGLVVADVNGDGIPDFVAAIPTLTNNTLGVLFGNGDGTFQAPVNYASASQVSLSPEFTADFNGDGRADLVQLAYSNSPETQYISVELGSQATPTVSTLASSLNPSLYGIGVTLTSTVSPASATGTVMFYSGTTEIGTVGLKDGTATLSISTLSVGTDTLSAQYGGDARNLPSPSNTISELVNPTPTSITLLSSPNPSTLGQTVTLVAEIAPAAATGSIVFYHGTTVIGSSAVINGRAAIKTSTLSEGPHALSATYIGNTDYLASTSATITQTVN